MRFGNSFVYYRAELRPKWNRGVNLRQRFNQAMYVLALRTQKMDAVIPTRINRRVRAYTLDVATDVGYLALMRGHVLMSTK